MFNELYLPVIHSLEELESHHNNDTASKAHQLLSAMSQGQFVLSLKVMSLLLSHTLSLCKVLQTVNIDYTECVSNVTKVITIFRTMRQEANTIFSSVFKESNDILEKIDSQITLPRMCSRQTKRSNVPANSPEEYYKRSIFIPFVDHLIQELSARFSPENETIAFLQSLLPQNLEKQLPENFMDHVNLYHTLMPNVTKDIFEAERNVWREYCISNTSGECGSKSAIDTYLRCNEKFYPNVKMLLRILITLPVTTSSVERSFSTLRRLKTYLRNCTKESRLNGLTLMTLHRDVELLPESVLEKFARKRPRQENFY